MITVVTGVLTVVYIDPGRRPHPLVARSAALPAGSAQAFIGALVFVMTGFGLGWVNAAADYSRYLPRRSSGAGVVGWTTFGASLAPGRPAGLRAAAGRLVHRSSARRSAPTRSARWPTMLPTWFLVPFAIVAVLGLIGGAVLDIYSSGLALLARRPPASRGYVAALIDGVLMIARHDLHRLLRGRLPRASSRAS